MLGVLSWNLTSKRLVLVAVILIRWWSFRWSTLQLSSADATRFRHGSDTRLMGFDEIDYGGLFISTCFLFKGLKEIVHIRAKLHYLEFCVITFNRSTTNQYVCAEVAEVVSSLVHHAQFE